MLIHTIISFMLIVENIVFLPATDFGCCCCWSFAVRCFDECVRVCLTPSMILYNTIHSIIMYVAFLSHSAIQARTLRYKFILWCINFLFHCLIATTILSIHKGIINIITWIDFLRCGAEALPFFLSLQYYFSNNFLYAFRSTNQIQTSTSHS